MNDALFDQVARTVDRQRLIDTAVALVEVPSPTRSAGPAADRLAEILTTDGFSVQRHDADWPQAPIVMAAFDSGRPGPTLQFDGHLDTVHLPYVPPRVENDTLYGSSSADMKGGIAAALEALRVLRTLDALPAGRVLFTAHDHHEGPWGDGRQVRAMIREGLVGDAVMLPEYLATPLPVAGRGLAIFQATIRRDGEPVHEVLRPPGTPDVVAAGAQLVNRLHTWNEELEQKSHPLVGHDSTFVGNMQAGEIYNQSPAECLVQGTRRWVPPSGSAAVQDEFSRLLAEVAAETGTAIDVDFAVQGGAYQIDSDGRLVHAFQQAHTALAGAPLPLGAKLFVDDGNIYASEAGIPALTHGPAATGAHTLHEATPVEELVRVAKVYALTAVAFCGEA
ncbi:MAG: M20/M25/M40 family metallo-hydrolase [Caldilineaceae bacterium]|nr:M20/M25/M40 family metallo-hydrolase [Caldilineaceae bacterium]